MLFLRNLLKDVVNMIRMGNVHLVPKIMNTKTEIANLRDVLKGKKNMNIAVHVKLDFMEKVVFALLIKMEVKILVLLILIKYNML